MPDLLGASEPTPEEQEANDQGRPYVVALVVASLLVFAWAFTDLAAYVGLPTPRGLFESLGLGHLPVFGQGGVFTGALDPDLADHGAGHSTRLVFLGGLLVAFLVTYFAPVRWKRPALSVLGLALIAALFGARAAALLTASLLFVYVTFHPKALRARRCAGASGALAAFAFVGLGRPLAALVSIAVAGTFSAGFFALIAREFELRPRAAKVARVLVSQAALVLTLGALVRQIFFGSALSVPFGIVLFLWQFERLMFYAGDYEDGAVPEDMPLLVFLSVFVSPPEVLLWTRGLNVGQGYSYQAATFMALPKNQLVRRGLYLWALGFLYMAFGDALMKALGDGVAALIGVPVYTLFPDLIGKHLGDKAVSPQTVLVSTYLSQVRWYVGKAGPIHFMVGAYRILGYDVAAHYDMPLIATNLVSLWARFTFHFREFLGRAFYYPTFFKLKKMPLAPRIIIATFMAAGVGNLLWGHAVFESVSQGVSAKAFLTMLRLWPYFLLLGGGISLTEAWLLRKGRSARKPWTWGWRIGVDVVCAYATFQYFALIEIFFFVYKTPGRGLHDYWALFARAFGINL